MVMHKELLQEENRDLGKAIVNSILETFKKGKELTVKVYSVEGANGFLALAYDQISNEIVMLDGRTDQTFHGHVRSWAELDNTHKAFMRREFGFSPKGKFQKLKE